MTGLLELPTQPSVKQPKKRDYISYSAISTYQQCPLKYFFKYIVGLPEVVVSSSLILGGAIHSAAEFHFNELMIGNPAPDRDMLLSAFWDEWHERAEEVEIRFGKNEDINKIAEMADRILVEFQQSELAIPQGQILGVEEQLRGELIPGIPDLLARIDLITESDDVLTITDFKTSRSRWNGVQTEDSGEQLLLYSELAKQLAPGKKIRLEFAVITKTATPVAERWPVTYDPTRITRTRQVIERVWSAIEAQTFYPAPSPMTCGCCPFRDPCRKWRG